MAFYIRKSLNFIIYIRIIKNKYIIQIQFMTFYIIKSLNFMAFIIIIQ